MPWIQYETPKNLRTHHKKCPISTLATVSVKCVTLLVWEYVDMIETTSPINNQQHDLNVHDYSGTFHKQLYRLNHNVEDSNNPIFHSHCLRYFTCARFDRRYHHT
jgi:hypothetical protein